MSQPRRISFDKAVLRRLHSDADLRAIEIYKDWIDMITPRILDGNFEDCLRFWVFPFRSVLFETSATCEGEGELIQNLTAYRDTLLDQGVDELRREVEDARLLGPDTLDGFHITYAFKEGTPVVDPYAARIRLVRRDGLWRAAEQEAAIANGDWPLLPTPRHANRS